MMCLVGLLLVSLEAFCNNLHSFMGEGWLGTRHALRPARAGVGGAGHTVTPGWYGDEGV